MLLINGLPSAMVVITDTSDDVRPFTKIYRLFCFYCEAGHIHNGCFKILYHASHNSDISKRMKDIEFRTALLLFKNGLY